METVKKMIESHPISSAFDTDELSNCIMQCFSCGQVCTTCADACLTEENVQELTKCIRLNLDCADVCIATGKMMSRLGSISDELLKEQLRACMTACEICGDECSVHKHHEHCVICTRACNDCRDACEKMLSQVSVGAR